MPTSANIWAAASMRRVRVFSRRREGAGAAVVGGAARQIAGGIAAGILRAGGHRVRPRGTSLYLGKDRLQLGFRAVILFTPLVLAAALGKALIQNFQEGKNDHERRFG